MAATLKVDTIQNASSATANITLDTNGNATVGNTLAMGSSFLRNRIINGGMNIWQRGTSFTIGALTGTYTADRFYFFCGNSSSTISRDTSVPSTSGSAFQYSLKMQRTAGNAGTNNPTLVQVIEAVNCFDLSSQNVTLSFWAKAGANYSGGNMGVQVVTGTVADQGVGLIFGSWTGGAAPINTSQAITTTWTKYTYTGTFGSGVQEAGLVLYYTPSGTAGADDSIYITGVQLEVGSVATPFERRQYGQELALCQRYLPAFSGNGSGNSFPYFSLASSTTQSIVGIPFPVATRVPATGIVASTASGFALGNGVTNYTCTSLAFAAANVTGGSVVATVASGLTQYYPYFLVNGASTLLYFTGCEL